MEAAMLQHGIYGINESEFLTMMELACQPRDLNSNAPALSSWDKLSAAHIITGLEVSRMNLSPAARAIWLSDQRLRNLAKDSPASNVSSAASQDSGTANILSAAFGFGGESAVKDAVKEIILKEFSKLALVPLERLEQGLARPLADFGMDSMISSELRALAWKEFRAEISFMKVLEKGLLVGEFVDLVWEKMDANLKGATS